MDPQGDWQGSLLPLFELLALTTTKNARLTIVSRAFRKAAATYSPTWWGSTIGASELNFSVRYGKRWILTAITTAV